MIKFSCKNCGREFRVADKHSGKRMKCPDCGIGGVVPTSPSKIKFGCENCNHIISVPQSYAGKKGRCPKCKNPVVVPSAVEGSVADEATISVPCFVCEKSLQVPESSIGQTVVCPDCGSYLEVSSGGVPAEAVGHGSSASGSEDEDAYDAGSEVPEYSTGFDRRLIFIISGASVVLVVGLIVLIAVILPSDSRPADIYSGQRDQRQPSGEHSPSLSVTTNTESQDLTGTSHAFVPIDGKLEDTLIAFRSNRGGVTKIYGVRPDGSELRDLTNNWHGGEIWPSWSPDGKALVFACTVHTKDASGVSRSDLDILITNVDGTGRRNLTNNPVGDRHPLWSPDGSMIAYLSDIENNLTFHLHVVNADGSGLRNLTNAPTRYPSWSPDGKKLACFVERDGEGAIYIMNSDGSEEKRLDKTTTSARGGRSYTAGEGRSCWSPDGTMIAFISKKDIYVAGADGSGWKRLVDNSTQEVCASWSPDGRRIAFISYRGRERELHVMNWDGSEQQMLAEYLLDDSLTWSPDGRKIAFASNRDGDNEIYVINVDGSGLQNLTNSPANEDSPAWSPFLPSEIENGKEK